MISLRICIVGNKYIEQDELLKTKASFKNRFPDINVQWTDKDPEIILFSSGGSELQAKNLLEENKFYILAADNMDNSYAAATEVKAYSNKTKAKTKLVNITEQESVEYINEYYTVKEVLNKLNGMTVGLIGKVSDWLIASGNSNDNMYQTFGILTENIEWKKLDNFKDIPINNKFNGIFGKANADMLDDSERVYELIKKTVTDNNWDACTTECFPLVREHKVTACLALSKLNEEGIPSGCEGDIPSIIGMMLAKELTGIVPWMANTASVTKEKALFAHCTVAPGLIKNMTLMSHYETNEGLAVQGEFEEDEITIFRLNSFYSKIFICEGRIINRPKYTTACRTQIEVKLSEKDTEKLRENPLGNHHIIIPGNWANQLEMIAKIKGIEIV